MFSALDIVIAFAFPFQQRPCCNAKHCWYRSVLVSDISELAMLSVILYFIRRVEVLTKEKSESERLKMEVEAAYRTLQYKHDQESEARRVSEALHSQLKEQIARSDEKLAKYVNINAPKLNFFQFIFR